MSSTRAELSGIFTSLTYLRFVVEFFKINPHRQEIQCTLHCDRKVALQQAKDISYEGFGTSWRRRTNYDLKETIKKCVMDGHLQIEWKCVKGHASRRKKSFEFTWAEELNEKADDIATEASNDMHITDTSH